MAHHLDHIGQRIGDYHLLRWLGGGGFGHVYLAEHIRDRSQVAIKLLHIRLSHSEELKAFINEARTMRLKHAHIVPLLDFGISQEEIPYLVMEFAAGGTLGDCHPKGVPLPLPLVADYAQQVGSALQYAHNQHLIHRDVKPQNMLLREDGTVLLSDFGLVAVLHSFSSQDSHQRMGGGTIAYMAPEQILGQVQAACDQYSLGVVVYEWITGRLPFEGTVLEVSTQHVMRPPPSLRAQVPTLPQAVEEVILKALAKDSAHRFVTVQAFTLALEQVIRDALTIQDAHQISSLDNNKSVSYTGSIPVLSSQPLSTRKQRVDWGDTLTVPFFYGREQEQGQLIQWVVQDHCRVASVLGMGGIGKSALVINVAHQLTEGVVSLTSPFEVIIVRSLRDAPSCEALLDDCLQVLFQQPLNARPLTLERRISLLLSYLRKVRALIVLDNLEDLLLAGDTRGLFRPGFEGYGLLLHRMAETEHQSCLLLTSREKPVELRDLSGKYSLVRTLRLTGLDLSACKQLLAEKELVGTEEDVERLIEIYMGNPLALKIVGRTIVDLFGGKINLFLASGIVVFGSIIDLLDEQFVRLSTLEQSVLCWLAIMREPVTLGELSALMVTGESRAQVFEAIDAGYRRSLIERGKRAGTFTLQSVVLEYVTADLVTKAGHEIKHHHLDKLIQYGFSQARTKEYVRQIQERLLLSPLLAELQRVYASQADGATGAVGVDGADPHPMPCADPVEVQLLSLLDLLRKEPDNAQGYGPANLIALLRLLRGNLSNLDLSQLCIRDAYLQGIEMQETSLSGSLIQDCVWTSAVDVAWAAAMSGDGKWWASGGIQGQVRIWEGVHPYALHINFQAHTDFVYSLAFSPDGQFLASGSQDGTIKLWEVSSLGVDPRGALLWTVQQSFPLSLAFSPDGLLLASGELHATIRVFDSQSGTQVQTFTQKSDVWAIAWSPDGSLLGSGGKDGEIRLWEREMQTELAFTPHLWMQTNWVSALSFSPDGRMLASTSWGDQTVKLWEVARHHGAIPSGQLPHILPGYADQSRGIAWSPDGRLLAYSNPDKGICVFDVEASRCRAVLHGHSTDIYGMAFTPDGTRLFSGSSDGTLRVWDVSDYRCVRVIQGYGVYLYDLAWSPDGAHLISGDTNGLVTVWNLSSAVASSVLYNHTWIVEAVGWSSNAQYCSSCGLDGHLCLWDATSHTLLQRFENARLLLLSMAWSPNGNQLACGTYGQGIQVWDAITRSLHFVGQTHPVAFWCVDWSPNSMQLVGGGHDGCLYLWECKQQSEQAQDTGLAQGTVPTRLSGHHSRITSVAWSPNGKWLASGSGTSNEGELFVWDVEHAIRVKILEGHPSMVYALTWSYSHENQLISAGADGRLYWWNVETSECIITQEAHQGTIRSLKVSPDGQFLASCGDDGAIKIWDWASHKLVQTLRHNRPYERLNITGIRGLNTAQIASLQALGAIDEATP